MTGFPSTVHFSRIDKFKGAGRLCLHDTVHFGASDFNGVTNKPVKDHLIQKD